jgi:hypothetical protein
LIFNIEMIINREFINILRSKVPSLADAESWIILGPIGITEETEYIEVPCSCKFNDIIMFPFPGCSSLPKEVVTPVLMKSFQISVNNVIEYYFWLGRCKMCGRVFCAPQAPTPATAV